MNSSKFSIKIDCRRFRGDVPCSPGALCDGCKDYEPMGKRILIIKLGAIGDVLRTTPVLPELHKEFDPCHITWIVDADCAPLLKNKYIDRLVTYGPEAIVRVMVERFDVVYSLDKHPGAAGLAAMAGADNKIGFILDSAAGAISFTGESAEYSYRLGLDDNLKFKENTKTYQEMTFDLMGLGWQKQKYILELPDEMREFGKVLIEDIEFKGDGPVIGLATGAGPVWPMKRWTVEGFSELADRLVGEMGARVVLLGAEHDRARNLEIQTMSHAEHPLAPHDMQILEFAGLLSNCDAIVTGDTAAMHLGLALDTPTVALFGPTSAKEVELYECGKAIVTPLECSPCYRSSCDVSPTCMDRITVDDIFQAVTNLLK